MADIAAKIVIARTAAASEFRAAAAAKKCWSCGCLHDALETLEHDFPPELESRELVAAVAAARAQLRPMKYTCLGCEICYPARALNALTETAGDRRVAATCPAAPQAERIGWPPLPGAYTALRYNAPVAVCTLVDAGLAAALVRQPDPAVAIVGTLETENLGIERLVTNVLADPHIRFLVLCGAESRQAIGHLPGASLVALARSGLDERGRIVGAPGKRPVIRNLSREAVEHFRRTVEVIDRIGTAEFGAIIETVRAAATRADGPADPFTPDRTVQALRGYLPARMVPDPAGYFVVYLDRAKALLSLEHFTRDGVLDAVIEGHTPAEAYGPAIERQLLTRLDHAAYLGRELARAEAALRTGEPYRQDGVSEQVSTADESACHCRPEGDASAGAVTCRSGSRPLRESDDLEGPIVNNAS